MLFIAENLKALRKEKGMTQEEVSEMLNVSAQSVSKWERGDTFPDITLLPSLANLYKTSVDALIGMDKINDAQARTIIFEEGHQLIREGDVNGAAAVYTEALKTFPSDESIMAELAFALALDGNPAKLKQAVTLCERVLASNPTEKVRHTTRAALCYIYMKAGEKEKAVAAAQNLPHVRESRETILAQFEKNPATEEIDVYLRFIMIGGDDEQEAVTVEFGVEMVPVITESNLLERIRALRGKAGTGRKGYHILPPVRVRDNTALSPNQVRIRHYADCLFDKTYTDCAEVVNEIILALQKIVKK